jgi:hypothetical protein
LEEDERMKMFIVRHHTQHDLYLHPEQGPTTKLFVCHSFEIATLLVKSKAQVREDWHVIECEIVAIRFCEWNSAFADERGRQVANSVFENNAKPV